MFSGIRRRCSLTPVGAALALARVAARPPAGAWRGRADGDAPGGEHDVAGLVREPDLALGHRLAQPLERPAAELVDVEQQKHTVVRDGGFARQCGRWPLAAPQRAGGDGVVRRPERPRGRVVLAGDRQSADRGDGFDVEPFRLGHWRQRCVQQSCQPHHRLVFGCFDQQVVPAGCGDGDRLRRLAAPPGQAGRSRDGRFRGRTPLLRGGELAQRVVDRDDGDDLGLGGVRPLGVVGGDDQRAVQLGGEPRGGDCAPCAFGRGVHCEPGVEDRTLDGAGVDVSQCGEYRHDRPELVRAGLSAAFGRVYPHGDRLAGHWRSCRFEGLADPRAHLRGDVRVDALDAQVRRPVGRFGVDERGLRCDPAQADSGCGRVSRRHRLFRVSGPVSPEASASCAVSSGGSNARRRCAARTRLATLARVVLILSSRYLISAAWFAATKSRTTRG